MKLTLSFCVFGVLFLQACSSVKVIETHADGGTLKYRRRGLAAESREEKSFAEADEHCKRNGYKTYHIDGESQDGRYMLVRFSCKN